MPDAQDGLTQNRVDAERTQLCFYPEDAMDKPSFLHGGGAGAGGRWVGCTLSSL